MVGGDVPYEGRGGEPGDDIVVCAVVDLCEEEDALLVVLVWRVVVGFHDEEGPGGGDGLEVDVGVVEVGARVVQAGSDFVVKVVLRLRGC